MRTLPTVALLASLLLAPGVSAGPSESSSCEGLLPGIQCAADAAKQYCTGGSIILSQCYGYTLVALLNAATGACDDVFGPGRCPA